MSVTAGWFTAAPLRAVPAAGTEQLRALFGDSGAHTYLDWAGVGLPLRGTVDAISAALGLWASGTLSWETEFEPAGEEARDLIAALLDIDSSAVALMPAVSVATALVVDAMPPDATVLVPDTEFASVLLPLEHAARRGRLHMRRVPFSELAAEVKPGVDLIAASLVRSDGGGRLELDAVSEAARRVGAQIYLDVTHAVGVLDVTHCARQAQWVAAAGYKHLLCPRGVAFLKVPSPTGHASPFGSWRGLRADRSYYGASLHDLHQDARGMDVSLSWLAWVGAVPALRLLAAMDRAALQRHAIALADAAATRLEVEPTGSSILGVRLALSPEAIPDLLAAHGIRASVRAGAVRISFHAYNDDADVDAVVDALRPYVDRDVVRGTASGVTT